MRGNVWRVSRVRAAVKIIAENSQQQERIAIVFAEPEPMMFARRKAPYMAKHTRTLTAVGADKLTA
jgi:hypothetical protein